MDTHKAHTTYKIHVPQVQLLVFRAVQNVKQPSAVGLMRVCPEMAVLAACSAEEFVPTFIFWKDSGNHSSQSL